MKKNNKKGFTIVELVIVIAVIAILAGVLIPTFSSVVKKARLSADQQAIRQMNTALAVEDASKDDMNIFDIFDVLAESGMDAKEYKALSTDVYFFWDSEINRVLMVKNGKSIYPEEYKDRTNKGKWSSLTQKIAKEPAAVTGSAATVEKAGHFVDALDKANTGSVQSITLPGEDSPIDMMGASVTIDKVAGSKTVEIAGGVIENATAIEAKTKFDGSNGHDGVYNMAMVTTVEKGATLHLKDLTIKNMNLKDTNAGNCGFLVGLLSGKLILENVTIEDSSIIGYTSVAALVGYMTGTGSIEIRGTLTLKNVSIQTVGGRVGIIVANMGAGIDKITAGPEAKIVMQNVTTGIYACEQNTGACVVDGCAHGALGLDGDIIHSWQIEGDGTLGCAKQSNRVFYKDSLFGFTSVASKREEYNNTFRSMFSWEI